MTYDFKIITQTRARSAENRFNMVGKIRLKFLVLFSVLALIIVSTQLVFAASLATDGQKLAQIDSEIRRLEDENTTLKVKIAQESSLNSLSKKAQELGFDEPSKIINP